MSTYGRLLMPMIALLITGCNDEIGGQEERFENETYIEGLVISIVDGDSLYIDGVGRQIRLFGVDAPERNEPQHSEATNFLRSQADKKHA